MKGIDALKEEFLKIKKTPQNKASPEIPFGLINYVSFTGKNLILYIYISKKYSAMKITKPY